MHEDRFEKQVREKMDQLGFDPSDAVWAEVDREINKGKKRRRPLFWVFLFSGLVLAGGGMYIAGRKNPSGNTTATKPKFSTTVNRDRLQESIPGDRKFSTQDAIQHDGQSDARLKRSARNKSGGASSSNQQIFTSHQKPQKREDDIVLLQQPNSSNPVGTGLEENKKNLDESTDDGNTLTGKDSSLVADGKAEKIIQTLSGDSVSCLKTVKNNIHQTKPSPWSIGLTGIGGISNIHQSLIRPGNASVYPYYSGNTTAVSSSGPGANTTVAEIHSGFSFGLDVMVNRKLSNRLSLSAGLGYRYLSTKINTGMLVDSTLYVYAPNSQAAPVGSFYRNGNGQEHTNQYQFIELPVNLNLQLNKSRKNPVSWQAGFSLACMIGSNALLFDSYTNVYFVNRQSYNQIQWNAATAILVGFPVHDHAIQLGPQLQYGLTGLLKGGADNPGHLFFIGLTMTFIP